MKHRILINLLDEFNGYNIIATLNLKPEKVVFIYEDNEEALEEFNVIKEYLEDKLPDIEVTGEAVKEIIKENIEKIIGSYRSEDTVINISGGSKLMSLIAYQVAEEFEITSIFVDMDSEVVLDLSNNRVENLEVEFVDLEVEDFIESTGGEILSDSTILFDNSDVQEFVDYVVQHYDLWNKFKYILRDNNIIKHDKLLMDTVIVELDKIHKWDRGKYHRFFEKFSELNLLSIKYLSKHKMFIQFKSLEIKSLFFKTGTWLEILVYKVLKRMQDVDDVRSGVLFLWDDDVRNVKNEVDVVASAKSNLIYVSCKDTARYDEETLNELEVYSEHLGGDNVKKVLVTTKESYKMSTELRAKEMGITIIIFDGNVKKLRKNLYDIVVE